MNKRRRQLFKLCELIFAENSASKYLFSDKYNIQIRSLGRNTSYYRLKINCGYLKLYKTEYIKEGDSLGSNSFLMAAESHCSGVLPKYKTVEKLLLVVSAKNPECFFNKVLKLAPELEIE